MNKSNTSVSSSVTSSQLISLKLYEKLITELRCPGCSMPMRCPIRLCKTGHSICNDCIKILNLCPLCEEEFTLTRNLTLEALCSKAEFPCENSINGCRVRCTITLLDWHEKQCTYRIVKCFIGKVWGKCEWKGCEKNWLEHINKNHFDKIFTYNPTELNCYIKNDIKPLTAYYIFQIYDQVFSFYQIYDKINKRILWTMSYEPKDKNINKKIKYTFEIEIYNQKNPLKAIIQKYECHYNGDHDILRDGACATISMGDVLRFVDDSKILHYRVRINKVNNTKPEIYPENINKQPIPIDFQQTIIEGINHKQVPSNIIITRKTENLDKSLLSSNATDLVHSASESKIKSDSGTTTPRILSSSDSDSESDPELEEFVNNLFKKKFQISNLDQQENSSSTSKPILFSSSSTDLFKRRKNKIFQSFSKSYNGLKTNFIELKSLHKKKSKKYDNTHSNLELSE